MRSDIGKYAYFRSAVSEEEAHPLILGESAPLLVGHWVRASYTRFDANDYRADLVAVDARRIARRLDARHRRRIARTIRRIVQHDRCRNLSKAARAQRARKRHGQLCLEVPG